MRYLSAVAVVWMSLVAVLLTGCSSEPVLQIEKAWVRTAPPSASVMAGYLTLNNASSDAVAVIAASSPQFKAVEFHHMRMDAGKMIMRQLQQLDVAAQSSRELAPGGDHLMLISPLAPLAEGETVAIDMTWKAADGTAHALSLSLPVRAKAP